MANILLVDDSEDLLDALTLFLSMKGHVVEAASSNQKVKNALSVFIPDVILLDVRIGGEDGRELCKEIKEKYNANIPIVLVSASPELLVEYEQCKADSVIEKPFDLEDLMKTVNKAIDIYQNRIT